MRSPSERPLKIQAMGLHVVESLHGVRAGGSDDGNAAAKIPSDSEQKSSTCAFWLEKKKRFCSGRPKANHR